MSASYSTLTETATRFRCLQEYNRLVSGGSNDADIRSVLESLTDALAEMMPSSVGDQQVANRIGDIRTMVDAHLLATRQLTEAGTDPNRTADLLRRAYRQACLDLGTLIGHTARSQRRR